MSNIFTTNLDNDVLLKANNLRKHSQFAEKLINDLVSQFNAHVETKRHSQDKFEYRIYSLDQKNRYGWSTDFIISSDGIIFTDTRGTDVGATFQKLGMSFNLAKSLYDSDKHYISSMHFYNANTVHLKLWEKGLELAKQQGFTFTAGDCYNRSTSCHGLRLSTTLHENDLHLNDKIKIIIWCLMSHGITTKF